MLFLLAVLSAASAAPQIPLTSFYNPYLHYYPQYQVQRQVPLYYYPTYPQYAAANTVPQSPLARANWPVGGFLQEGAKFVATAAVASPAQSAKTLTGDITFWQNPFTLNNAKFHVNLPNVAASTNIGIYIHAAGGSCADTSAAAATILTKLSTPLFQINGAYVDGTTNLFNLDGAGGKTDVSGRFVSIRNEGLTAPASVIGCTMAGIA